MTDLRELMIFIIILADLFGWLGTGALMDASNRHTRQDKADRSIVR